MFVRTIELFPIKMKNRRVYSQIRLTLANGSTRLIYHYPTRIPEDTKIALHDANNLPMHVTTSDGLIVFEPEYRGDEKRGFGDNHPETMTGYVTASYPNLDKPLQRRLVSNVQQIHLGRQRKAYRWQVENMAREKIDTTDDHK